MHRHGCIYCQYEYTCADQESCIWCLIMNSRAGRPCREAFACPNESTWWYEACIEVLNRPDLWRAVSSVMQWANTTLLTKKKKRCKCAGCGRF